jgi:hypothetical protein
VCVLSFDFMFVCSVGGSFSMGQCARGRERVAYCKYEKQYSNTERDYTCEIQLSQLALALDTGLYVGERRDEIG